MRVALILGVLLILAVNVAAVAPPTEPFRPYLTDATLALSVLVLIGLLLPARQKPPPSKPPAEPARAAPPARRCPRRCRNRQLPCDAPGKGPSGRFLDGRHQPLQRRSGRRRRPRRACRMQESPAGAFQHPPVAYRG